MFSLPDVFVFTFQFIAKLSPTVMVVVQHRTHCESGTWKQTTKTVKRKYINLHGKCTWKCNLQKTRIYCTSFYGFNINTALLWQDMSLTTDPRTQLCGINTSVFLTEDICEWKPVCYLEGQLQILSSPKVKLGVVCAEVLEEFPIDGEKSPSHCRGPATHDDVIKSLQWRHNGRDGVSNHQPHDCLLNRLFRRRSKKTSQLRVTGLCAGNSPATGEFPHKWPVTRKMFPFDDVIMGT